MSARLFGFTFLSLMAGMSGAQPPDLPAPPDGFHWKWCDKVGVGLAQPKGWFFKSQSEKGTDAYFVTKEAIEAGGGIPDRTFVKRDFQSQSIGNPNSFRVRAPLCQSWN